MEEKRNLQTHKSVKARMKAISEDFRKIGVTAMSAGMIGLIITGNSISIDDAVQVWVCGVSFWAFALILIPKGD